MWHKLRHSYNSFSSIMLIIFMLLCYCASAFANPAVTYHFQMRPLTISENGYVATLTYDASGAVGCLATLFGGPIAGGIVVGSANSFVNQGFGMNGRWNWGNISTSRLLLDG